jgi:F-type H+-transporting ATPase subunit b
MSRVSARFSKARFVDMVSERLIILLVPKPVPFGLYTPSMDAALQKAIGELLLSAVPTIIIFLGLFAAYTFLVHRPLQKILAERHAKTEGAVAKAHADIAAADAKTAEYEQKLREARAAVYKQQEARRKQHLEARAAVIAEARKAAEAKVKVAKTEIEAEAATAKASLGRQSEELAQEIIRAVLQPIAAVAGGQ